MKENHSAVLLSIHRRWCEEIIAGRKTLELRKNFPQDTAHPFTVLLYETKADGGAGMIVGQFTCAGLLAARGVFSTMARRSLVEAEAIAKYAHGGTVYGWAVRTPRRYSQPVPLADIGVSRAPQSWCYLRQPAWDALRAATAPGGSPDVINGD